MDVRVLSDLSSQSSVTSSSWIPTLQVSGHAGTGKTQPMLQFALQMPQQGCQVHYLASSAGHSNRLLACLLLAQLAAGCSDSNTSSPLLASQLVQLAELVVQRFKYCRLYSVSNSLPNPFDRLKNWLLR
jgi:hypothetical protein